MESFENDSNLETDATIYDMSHILTKQTQAEELPTCFRFQQTS